MDVLEFLANRHSSGKLTSPGPSEAEVAQLLAIGCRAPDHGGLQPWHFVVMTGEGRARLGDIFAAAAIANNGQQPQVDKARKMPLRAPMVIAVIAKYHEHPKVPRGEQIASAGCALFSIQQGALAMGYGGIWRTGDYARDERVRQHFGLAAQDEIVGYLYLGTDQCTSHSHKKVDVDSKVSFWR